MEKDILECYYCEKIFISRHMRQRHHDEHKQAGDDFKNKFQLVACKYCSRFFPNYSSLGAHTRGDHPEVPRLFHCSSSYCKSSFKTIGELNQHTRNHRSDFLSNEVAPNPSGLDEDFGCKFCQKRFESFKKVSLHVHHIHLKKLRKDNK